MKIEIDIKMPVTVYFTTTKILAAPKKQQEFFCEKIS